MRWRFPVWLLLSAALTIAWWTAAPHLFQSQNIQAGLAVNQGVPIALNLALAWAFGLLGARTPGPAFVAVVMTAVALPYALLTLLLVLGRVFA
jgi:hypothetical protein